MRICFLHWKGQLSEFLEWQLGGAQVARAFRAFDDVGGSGNLKSHLIKLMWDDHTSVITHHEFHSNVIQNRPSSSFFDYSFVVPNSSTTRFLSVGFVQHFFAVTGPFHLEPTTISFLNIHWLNSTKPRTL